MIADCPTCCRCWKHLCYAKSVLQYVHQNRSASGFIFQTDSEQCLVVRLSKLKTYLEQEDRAVKIPITTVEVPTGKK